MSNSNLEQRLIAAYDKMLERVHDFFDASESYTAPTLQQRIALAKERAVELQEISSEEAEKVAAYIERDIHEAANYLETSGKALSSWFNFDLQLLEARMLEIFSVVADKTRIELAQLAQQAKRADQYHTGEITGIGQLTCNNCGNELHFKHTARIPPCGACHHTVFQREITD